MDNPDKHLLAKIGQYVLITNDNNQVLMLQRERSKDWSLPGGRLNKDDKDWEEGLKREVKEETGLSIKNLKPFDIKLIEDTHQIRYCVYFITDCLNTKEIRLSQEHISSKWINENNLKELVIDNEPSVRQVLEQYFIHSKV